MPNEHARPGSPVHSMLEPTRRLLQERGFSIPEADLGDVISAVDRLRVAVDDAVAALAMSTVPEPFQVTLKGLSTPPSSDESEPGIHDLLAGEISSQEWVRNCLARIQASPPGQLAWRDIDGDGALRRARELDDERSKGRTRGPLHGVPIGIKDMIDRRGHVAGWGSALRQAAAPAERDATIVSRLQNAGAIVLGSQHMAEFAMSPTGLNTALGPGRNPWNLDHVSGGSSSGAGMSVAAGHVPLAIGSDTGGSIRLPAALCGITGLKPTQHRISMAGVMPLSPSLDCVGPLGRSADICGWAYCAMAGADVRDPSCLDLPAPAPTWMRDRGQPLRVAVPDLTGSELVSADMLGRLVETRRALADAGVECVEIELPELDLYSYLGSVLLAVESAALHRRWLGDDPSIYGRQVRRRLSRGLLLSGLDYYDTLRLRAPLLRDFLKVGLPEAHALLLPATPDVAPSGDRDYSR